MPTPDPAPAWVRVCAHTGLALVASNTRSVFRVAKTQRGPFDPPLRRTPKGKKEAIPQSEWSRWDTAGRTIYAGSTKQGALLEALSYIKPDERPRIRMSDAFDDVTPDDKEFLNEQIANELPAHGGMPVRSVSKNWRNIRAIYEFELPATGWFVDITASDSIGTLDKQLRKTLADKHGIDELHLSHLTSDDAAARCLTTTIAGWVRMQELDDKSFAHGIVYPSKFGRDIENYAMWLRRRDDGTGDDVAPRRTQQNRIDSNLDAFQYSVKRLRLHPY